MHFRRGLVRSSLVMLTGLVPLIIMGMGWPGPPGAKTIASLVTLAGATLELATVWQFMRSITEEG
jgi:hypothetical protein